jgi:hypothetical protein
VVAVDGPHQLRIGGLHHGIIEWPAGKKLLLRDTDFISRRRRRLSMPRAGQRSNSLDKWSDAPQGLIR